MRRSPSFAEKSDQVRKTYVLVRGKLAAFNKTFARLIDKLVIDNYHYVSQFFERLFTRRMATNVANLQLFATRDTFDVSPYIRNDISCVECYR